VTRRLLPGDHREIHPPPRKGVEPDDDVGPAGKPLSALEVRPVGLRQSGFISRLSLREPHAGPPRAEMLPNRHDDIDSDCYPRVKPKTKSTDIAPEYTVAPVAGPSGSRTRVPIAQHIAEAMQRHFNDRVDMTEPGGRRARGWQYKLRDRLLRDSPLWTLSQPEISQISSGKVKNWSLDTILAVRQYVGVSLDQLLGLAEPDLEAKIREITREEIRRARPSSSTPPPDSTERRTSEPAKK